MSGWQDLIINNKPRAPGNVFGGIVNNIYDSKDYRALKEFGSFGMPYLSDLANKRADWLAYEENTRYWSDFAKNTGIDTGNWKYPIRMGLYGNPSVGFSMGTVSKPIMNLYKKSYKPRVRYIRNNYHYHYR